tara:strand:- start:40790 stop:41665 length:876 start_codon:yes stop_codon:yes gene_type:complete
VNITPYPKLFLANDLNEALHALRELADSAIPLAGATWVMRAPLRCETADQTLIDLSRIEALRTINIDQQEAVIGALATHEQIAHALQGYKDLAALTQAAGHSANPAIRRMATIGGNICTAEFAAADLVPALLALDARLEIEGLDGSRTQTMAAFLEGRATRAQTDLVTRLIIPRTQRTSTHARLTLRKAGDYPVANLSVSIALDAGGKISEATVAVGAVEAVAKRWTGFEEAIIGHAPSPEKMQMIAKTCLEEFDGRDATDAPGWYRLRVLPGLVANAFSTLQEITLGRAM